MGYHTLVYNASAATAGATNFDFSAATDTEISQRNSHYVFTESYRMLYASLVGVSVTRGRYQVPRWNAVGEVTIMNANRSLQFPSNPQVDLYTAYTPAIPQVEEFQVQASNNLGAATEIENCVICIAPDDWTMNLDRGEGIYLVRATATITPTLNGWSGANNIVLSQSLRGGTYGIAGTIVQGTNAVAYRWIFPRNRLYHGRRLRPGGLVQNAVGDVTNIQIVPWQLGLGMQGYFNTLELPQIEVFGTLAGAITYQIFIWLVRLGDDINILTQKTG